MPNFQLPLARMQIPQDDDFLICEVSSHLRTYEAAGLLPEKARKHAIAVELRKAVKERVGSESDGVQSTPSCLAIAASKTWEIFPGLDRDQHYGDALQRWRSVQYLFNSPLDAQNEGNHWSVAQQNAYRLLMEWWQGDLMESEVGLGIRDWIMAAAEHQIPCKLLPRITTSRFHMLMLNLWHTEFCIEDPRDGQLMNGRMLAASRAASQRLTRHSVLLPKNLCRQADIMQPCESGRPRVPDNNSYSQPTAAIQPCFWLERFYDPRPLDRESSTPYFLWDIQAGRTVETHFLPQDFRYAAISHTWGRWRLAETTLLDPPSSTPWCVPKNSLFDVRSLPVMLRGAAFPVPYVWLDLLCIPQEMESGSVWRTKAKSEIAKQAAIFKKASFACMWLNFVPSWAPLEGAIRWLSAALAYCEGDGDASDIDDIIRDAESKADTTTYLVSEVEGEMEVAGWFSSLWTLQEICLRPDMFLLDKDWQFLTTGDGVFKVPFDHIVALWSAISPAVRTYEGKVPRSISEIYFLLSETGLSSLHIMQPPTVLMLANQRYCQERRAEAIMSVIGITKWFTQTPPDQDDPRNEGELMLGRYPFAFVQEARHEWGGTFFAVADQVAKEMNETGSMLPFSAASVASRGTIVGSMDNFDHPSIKTWDIRRNGSVLLKMVGTLARYCPFRDPAHQDPDQLARIIIPKGNPGFTETPPDEVSLREFLASFEPLSEKYALSLLCTSGGGVYGILIMRRSSGDFRKFGMFIFNSEAEHHKTFRGGRPYEFPPSKEVNWVVS